MTYLVKYCYRILNKSDDKLATVFSTPLYLGYNAQLIGIVEDIFMRVYLSNAAEQQMLLEGIILIRGFK